MVEDTEARRADKFGAIGINAFFSKSGRRCLTEAPNADAVHRSHVGYGIKMGKGYVTEVSRPSGPSGCVQRGSLAKEVQRTRWTSRAGSVESILNAH